VTRADLQAHESVLRQVRRESGSRGAAQTRVGFGLAARVSPLLGLASLMRRRIREIEQTCPEGQKG